jgi:hypothetical protein
MAERIHLKRTESSRQAAGHLACIRHTQQSPAPGLEFRENDGFVHAVIGPTIQDFSETRPTVRSSQRDDRHAAQFADATNELCRRDVEQIGGQDRQIGWD